MIVDLPCWPSPPMTKNEWRRQGHYHAVRRKWADALEQARWAVRAARLTPLTEAIVVLHWRQPDWRRRDGDGAGPTLSACLDALVQEGVIPDDSFRHVRHSGITCHDPIKGQPGALWLSITDPQETTA